MSGRPRLEILGPRGNDDISANVPFISFQGIIPTHSTEVLFLGQLLGISVIFPAMWLPAAFRGQGTGATSKGRVWMAMLTVVPITLVECTG